MAEIFDVVIVGSGAGGGMIRTICGCLLLPVLLAGLPHAFAQERTPGDGNLLLRDYAPKTHLQVKEVHIVHAKFPVIDIHFHMNPDADPAEVARNLDLLNVQTINNLGMQDMFGEHLQQYMAKWVRAYPGRFTVFANLNPAWINDADFGRKAVAQLREDVKNGAIGLKIFSVLGLIWKDKDGQLIRPNDPRFDPVWDAAAELNIPVLIHTSEPMSFFDPVDRFNERYLSLTVDHRGNGGYYGKGVTHQGLQDALENIIAKHPKTTFICAHMGLHYEHLYTGARWLDKYANVYFDTSASEKFLGRQPYTAHKFFMKYQDRLLFGSDLPMPGDHGVVPVKEIHQFEFRILETDDEYIDHIEPTAGLMWKLYGIDLPDEVLDKIYHLNAERVIPAFRKKPAPAAPKSEGGR